MWTSRRRLPQALGTLAALGLAFSLQPTRSIRALTAAAHAAPSALPAPPAPPPAAPPPAPPPPPPPPPPAAPPAPPPPAPKVPTSAPPASAAAASAAAPAATSLSTLAAYLFHTTGTVGGDDIAIDPTARHIPQAAIDAPTLSGPAGPSLATLVVVGVSGLGATRPYTAQVTVSLTASTKAGKVLLQKSVKLPRPTDKTPRSFKVPFLLYDTGCDSLRLVATITPAPKGTGARLERLVPFHCGG